MDDAEQLARRPVPARETGWAHRAAPKLQRLRLTPNQISIASVVFAALAAPYFVASVGVDDGSRIVLLLIAAAMMPLRLLCNLFDGMLAVEGGMKQDSLCATRDEMDTKGMLSSGFPRVNGLAAAFWIQRVTRRSYGANAEQLEVAVTGGVPWQFPPKPIMGGEVVAPFACGGGLALTGKPWPGDAPQPSQPPGSRTPLTLIRCALESL